jgi:protein TonB
MPRTDRRYGAGVVWALGLHGVFVAMLVLGWTETFFQAGSDRGPGTGGGGGGGGGGRSIQYIQLPPAPAARAAPAPSVERQEITLPKPTVTPAQETPILPKPELTIREASIPVATVPTPAVSAVQPTLGPGSGTGVGPGQGAGSGGGSGTGRGAGTGSGVGPGTGGDGTVAYAPEPRAIIYPFEEPPASVKGRIFQIRFWVDRRGRVVKVEIEPKVEDAGFRKKLLERVESWTFYPARTIEGRPVNGELVITYRP